MFRPKVSIIIPVYNGANYLAEAINSALAQDYSDFEVIVVNDGSTDDGATEAIARDYGDRIRYIVQENGGVGAALNAGIAAMEGEYFSWLSHDDLYPPDKLSHQIAILSELSNKQTVLFGNYRLINSLGQIIDTTQIEKKGTASQLDLPLFGLTQGLIHGCALLIAKAHFANFGLFNPQLKTTQDYDLWFRMFRHLTVHFDAKPVVLSRVHPEQGSRTLPQMKLEGERLWMRFVEEVTIEEAEAMHGSRYRFLQKTADLLVGAPYADVVPTIRERAREALAQTLVSVVIPFRDRIGWTLEAVQSAQVQSHDRLDIILIDDGSADDTGALVALSREDVRVRIVRQPGSGAAAARNRGIKLAEGRYIAFLDSDDSWAPNKIARQLRLMEDGGLAMSHTSYVRRQEVSGSVDAIHTAFFSGCVYPRIVAFCPIATPTVMVRADVMLTSPFPEAMTIGEDVATWMGIAADHEIGALDAALTTVRISENTTSASPERTLLGLWSILAFVVNHPRHGRQHQQIVELLDVVRRYHVDEMLQAPAAGASGRLEAVWRRRLGRVLFLGQAGMRSLRHAGVVPTLRRTLAWLRNR